MTPMVMRRTELHWNRQTQPGAWLTSGIQSKPTAQRRGLSSQGLPSRASLMSSVSKFLSMCMGACDLTTCKAKKAHLICLLQAVPKRFAEYLLAYSGE